MASEKSNSGETTRVLYETVRDTEVLVISPSATSPRLTEIDELARKGQPPGLLWRTIPPDDAQAAALARLGKERIDAAPLNTADVALVYESADFGDALRRAVSLQLAHLIPSHPLHPYPFRGDHEREEVLKMALLARPRLLYFFSSSMPDYWDLFHVLQQSTWRPSLVLLPDSGFSRGTIGSDRIDENLASLVVGTKPSIIDRDVEEAFARKLEARYAGENPPLVMANSPYAPYAYDAAWLSFAGIAWSLARHHEVTGLFTADGLKNVSCRSCETLLLGPANWPKVRDRLQQADPVNLEGVSGDLDYDPKIEELKSDVDVWKFERHGESWDPVVIQRLSARELPDAIGS